MLLDCSNPFVNSDQKIEALQAFDFLLLVEEVLLKNRSSAFPTVVTEEVPLLGLCVESPVLPLQMKMTAEMLVLIELESFSVALE